MSCNIDCLLTDHTDPNNFKYAVIFQPKIISQAIVLSLSISLDKLVYLCHR